MNKNNLNSRSLPRLLIWSFLMSSPWTKIHSFFPFSFIYRESLKEERRPAKFALMNVSLRGCTHRICMRRDIERWFLPSIDIAKEAKKTLFWTTFPGQDPILLASPWKNANSLKGVRVARLCRASTYKSTLELCTEKSLFTPHQEL